MSWFLAAIGFVLVIIWALTLFDLFRGSYERNKKVAWALIIILLPVIGALAYWFTRPASSEEIAEHIGAQGDLRRGPQDHPSHPPGAY